MHRMEQYTAVEMSTVTQTSLGNNIYWKKQIIKDNIYLYNTQVYKNRAKLNIMLYSKT